VNAQPQEIPLKQWFCEQAKEAGLSVAGIITRYYKGRLPPPSLRRVNKRVVYVRLSAS
jgi:hypothetical protein